MDNTTLETCTPDTLIAYTDGSCPPNPGLCGAGACIHLPFETQPVNLKQPVSKCWSILLGEMAAIKLVLDFIMEKLNQKLKLKQSPDIVRQPILSWTSNSRMGTNTTQKHNNRHHLTNGLDEEKRC